MYNTLTCLFGHHDYSEELTKDKEGYGVHLCKVCKRNAYRDTIFGYKSWSEYDEEGNLIRIKFSNGGDIIFERPQKT